MNIEERDRALARTQDTPRPSVQRIESAISTALDHYINNPERVGNAMLSLYALDAKAWRRACALLTVAMMEPNGDSLRELRKLLRNAMTDVATADVMWDFGISGE